MYRTFNVSTFMNGLLLGMIIVNIYYINKLTDVKRNVKTIKKVSEVPTTVRIIPTYPTSISSRGHTHFKQIGILFNSNKVTLPLFGKPTYRGSNYWNYYTYVNSYNQIMVPLEIDDRDCMKDIGCKELFDDDKVFLKTYGDNFTVKLYDLSLKYQDL